MLFKKNILFFLLFVLLLFKNSPVFANSPASEFLYEVGLELYKQGHYVDALHEFRKALLINPGYEPAQKYIELIQYQVAPEITLPGVAKIPRKKLPVKKHRAAKPKIAKGIVKGKEKIVEEYLNKIEKGIIPKEVTPSETVSAVPEKEKSIAPKVTEAPYIPKISGIPSVPEKEIPSKKAVLPSVLVLDENIKSLKFPLEIEQGKSILIKGRNISRYLSTEPDVLYIQRVNSDQISVTGKKLGYTYLHIWDDRDRWTLEFLTVPLRPLGPTLEEEMRTAEESSKNFKLSYSLNWQSFETGKRLYSLRRLFYSWNHLLNLVGETPYGVLDSGFAVSVTNISTDLTYVTLGLENGKAGQFKDFRFRAFDFFPKVQNLAFSSETLRGVTFSSPAFNNKLNYTVFWGREGGGKYAGFSPGLQKIRNSFLSGFNVDFYPVEKQSYSFSVFHGWGRERAPNLNAYGYDFSTDYKFNNLGLGYEVAYDSESSSHRLRSSYDRPKLHIDTELRNTAKNFKTMTGFGQKVGEQGLLTNLSYVPLANLSIGSRLDVYKERRFPNPKNPNALNEDFSVNAGLQVNPLTNLSADYNLQNDLGSISELRSHVAGIGLNRTFEWIRKIYTHVNYQYTSSTHFASHSLDYSRNRIAMGFRFSLIGALNYFLDQEFSWVKALSTNERVQPRSFETGVDWNKQIFNTPFYGNMRFIYHAEENTLSPFSFLSGEDYIEGYTEVSYRPKPELEAYFNTRVRNVWAVNPDVTKHIDVSFNSGMRYLWDTGIRWESVGTIEGFVFKDLNSDGLRQNDEPPIRGVKVWVGKDKTQVTDQFGYYKFTKVKAKKAYVSIDTTTISEGFTLTVPATQNVTIQQGRAVQVNFGIISRTEITGAVFEDVDGHGQLSPRSKGVKGIILILEDGRKVTTDMYGRYTFKNVAAGKHRLILDLKSVPTEYIPTVPIYKEVEVSEGMSYPYNIPLKKTQ